MQIEWLFANVTPVGWPARAKHDILSTILEVFWPNSGCFCAHGATLSCRNPLLSTNIFTWGHLLKIEWLVVDLTSFRFPIRAECDILGWFRTFFGHTDHLCGRGATLWCSNPFLSPNTVSRRNLANVMAHVPKFIILHSNKERALYDSIFYLYRIDHAPFAMG